MQDVTNLILNYRDAVRHLWSTYLEPFNDDEMPSLFFNIEYRLFYSLVVWPLGRPSNQQSVSGDFRYGQGLEVKPTKHDPDLPYLHIVPQLDAYPDGIPVCWFGDPRGHAKSIYADDPDMLTTADIDIRFVDLYSYGDDFRYCDGRVYQYYGNVSTVPTHIRIELQYVRFVFDDQHTNKPADSSAL